MELLENNKEAELAKIGNETDEDIFVDSLAAIIFEHLCS
jgi:hypothetical protein